MEKITNIENNDKKINFVTTTNKAKFKKNILHTMCSYAAMFPPKLVNNLILNYSKKGDLVYDPFSCGGTTLFQARLLNRKSYASDLNPLAYFISKSKIMNISKQEILSRLNIIEAKYNLGKFEIIDKEDFDYMSVCYSKKNLEQLFFLKQEIGINWYKNDNIDNYILSCILGILHGPTKKN